MYDLTTPWTAHCQALLSMELLGKKTAVGCHFPSPVVVIYFIYTHTELMQSNTIVIEPLRNQFFNCTRHISSAR